MFMPSELTFLGVAPAGIELKSLPLRFFGKAGSFFRVKAGKRS
jgi:hypothetical protein